MSDPTPTVPPAETATPERRRTVKIWERKLGFHIISYDGFRDLEEASEITEADFKARLVHTTQDCNAPGWQIERLKSKLEEAERQRDEARATLELLSSPEVKDALKEFTVEMMWAHKARADKAESELAQVKAQRDERENLRANAVKNVHFTQANADRYRTERDTHLAAANKMREALKFYTDINNFAVTVWKDDTHDGECWTEPASERGLTEKPNSDFGIRAQETLDALSESGAIMPPSAPTAFRDMAESVDTEALKRARNAWLVGAIQNGDEYWSLHCAMVNLGLANKEEK